MLGSWKDEILPRRTRYGNYATALPTLILRNACNSKTESRELRSRSATQSPTLERDLFMPFQLSISIFAFSRLFFLNSFVVKSLRESMPFMSLYVAVWRYYVREHRQA